MSCSTSDLAAAEIGVFWDMVDCPIPEDLCHKSVYVKIKSALENMGYLCKVSISAYSDMDHNLKKEEFESTGITLLPTGNKQARVNTILEDLMIWANDQHGKPINLMVISRDITKDKLYVKSLMFLKDWRNFIILLAQPENLAHDDDLSQALLKQVTAVWLWKNLSDGGKAYR
ncbi:NYN domain limkain-b1-type [Arabidopsis suecica]|uniref:NYN domain limkain-b1-type n=1 Tax=Arabidopsis suecica TaxID=45249 RepID=A0A8T2AKB0_ARASU|nr:NYN domain limkain-b1-type [Arabidopsis suecica]